MTTTETTTFAISIIRPELKEGETYIGAFITADGTGHHTILLPGDNDDAPWPTQMEWAASIGGDLPNRVEQAKLYADHKDLFQSDWYWSNTVHASHSDCAWDQLFGDGNQGWDGQRSSGRARAVRRVAIQ